MLMVTNSFIVIILNSFLLPITEEVRVGTSQRTIITCVMYYSKSEQEPSAFSKVLTEWSLTGAAAYESFSLESNGVETRAGRLREWLQGEL